MASDMRRDIVNALSIDVEDYFHVNAFKTVAKRKEWGSYPERVGDNTRRILDLLDEHATRGTFFVLGWVAERNPALVREIARRGLGVGPKDRQGNGEIPRRVPEELEPLTRRRDRRRERLFQRAEGKSEQGRLSKSIPQ